MKRYLCGVLALACLMGLTACGKREAAVPVAAEDEFVVTVVCESNEVNQIGYSSYIDGEYRTGGGGTELGGASTRGCTVDFHFSSDDFQDEDDISRFSMTLSPYGEGDERELTTTEPVAISAEYGKTYTIDLTGDRDSGFAAELKEV